MKLGIVFFLVFSMFTCKTNNQNRTITREGITLTRPNGWVEDKLPGHIILIRQKYLQEWSVRATFDVEIHKKTNDLYVFIENYKELMKRNTKIFAIISEKDINYKGFLVKELICSGFIGKSLMEWKTIMFIKNGKLYKFTTTNLVGQYGQTKKITEKIFRSVIIE